MKKWRFGDPTEWILLLLILLLLIPVSLIALILAPVWIPVEYCRFRRSPYRKEGRGNYELLITLSPYYRFYNLVRRQRLPIEYLPVSYPSKEGFERVNAYGHFLYGHTLVVIDVGELGYDAAADQFVIENDTDATPLFAGIEEMKKEVDRAKGSGYCTGAVVLVSKRAVEKITAEEPPSWCILYEKGRMAEALRAYIDAHPLS